MAFKTETWATAAGSFEVIQQHTEFDRDELMAYNKGKGDADAVWVTGKEMVTSPAFGFGDRAMTVLRRLFVRPDGRAAEVTLAINPDHIYSVRSTYTSTASVS